MSRETKFADESAFPWSGGERGVSDGVSRREWYAAMAMQGMMASQGTEPSSVDWIVATAFQLADAMIEKAAEVSAG